MPLTRACRKSRLCGAMCRYRGTEMEGMIGSILDSGKERPRVALINYTGTFHPVTNGHTMVIEDAYNVLANRVFDRVWTVPRRIPRYDIVFVIVAFNSEESLRRKMVQAQEPVTATLHSSVAARAALFSTATAHLPYVYVSTTYGSEIVSQIADVVPTAEITRYYLNGADDVVRYQKWREARANNRLLIAGRGHCTEEVLSHATDNRAPYYIVLHERTQISSSRIRRLLRDRNLSELRRHMHPGVLEHIIGAKDEPQAIRMLSLNISWGNTNGSERPFVLRCREANVNAQAHLAGWIRASVDVACLQEVASWSPIVAHLRDAFDAYHCLRDQTCIFVRKTLGPMTKLPISMDKYISGIRGMSAVFLHSANLTLVSAWFNHGNKEKKELLGHVANTVFELQPSGGRLVIAVDANDWEGRLQSNVEVDDVVLYNASIGMRTCCEDANYSMVGDYIFDTQQGITVRYMTQPKQAFEQHFGDHLGLLYDF